MSDLCYDFYNYCNSRGHNSCIDCKYNKNYTEDIIGCAMLFAYEKAIDDFVAKAEEERDNIYNWDDDDYENGMKAGYQYSIEIAEQLKKINKK